MDDLDLVTNLSSLFSEEGIRDLEKYDEDIIIAYKKQRLFKVAPSYIEDFICAERETIESQAVFRAFVVDNLLCYKLSFSSFSAEERMPSLVNIIREHLKSLGYSEDALDIIDFDAYVFAKKIYVDYDECECKGEIIFVLLAATP